MSQINSIDTIGTLTVATTQAQAKAAVIEHYNDARAQLSATGAFGKNLDRKARKLALRLGGLRLPEQYDIAWATPSVWGANGYRCTTSAQHMAARKK